MSNWTCNSFGYIQSEWKATVDEVRPRLKDATGDWVSDWARGVSEALDDAAVDMEKAHQRWIAARSAIQSAVERARSTVDVANRERETREYEQRRREEEERWEVERIAYNNAESTSE